MSVQEFPRRRAVEMPDAHALHDARVHISRVDAHALARRFPRVFPVRDATALAATDEAEAAISPDIRLPRAARATNANFLRVVVGPERAGTPADRTVATRQLARLARNLDADCTAVAGACDHLMLPDGSMSSIRLPKGSAT